MQGYNIYVNRYKLRLIDHTFNTISPEARSFADLGGVWKVNAAYSVYTVKNFAIDRGLLIDTDYPQGLENKLRSYPNLLVVRGDFGQKEIIETVGHADVIFFFDVLLHQANPDWDEILSMYSDVSACFVIYNQQYIQGEDTIRLTDLPLNKYMEICSDYGEDLYRYVYEHRSEMHPKHNKPWGDIHNIAQWGIVDRDLRNKMSSLGYREVYFENHGKFLDLVAFENHAFVFKKQL